MALKKLDVSYTSVFAGQKKEVIVANETPFAIETMLLNRILRVPAYGRVRVAIGPADLSRLISSGFTVYLEVPDEKPAVQKAEEQTQETPVDEEPEAAAEAEQVQETTEEQAHETEEAQQGATEEPEESGADEKTAEAKDVTQETTKRGGKSSRRGGTRKRGGARKRKPKAE